MFSTPRQRRTPQPPLRRSAAPRAGRVVCVFGPPQAGVTTLLKILQEASTAQLHVLTPDFGDLAEQIRQAPPAEVILVDGYPTTGLTPEGVPAGPDLVQYLYNERLIYPGEGALVRIDAGRDAERARAWLDHLPALEERVRLLDLPYFVVHNTPGEDGLAQAVGDLARRAGIAR